MCVQFSIPEVVPLSIPILKVNSNSDSDFFENQFRFQFQFRTFFWGSPMGPPIKKGHSEKWGPNGPPKKVFSSRINWPIIIVLNRSERRFMSSE